MLTESRKPRVLFLCTGNSCRSQMAEGWAQHMWVEKLEAYSAGIETHGLNPYAVQVMREVGVDISGHTSQHIREFAEFELDLVITVCDHAHEHCPLFPGACRVIHHSFDDPPRLAAEVDTEEEKLACYRRVRDAIRAYLEGLPDFLANTE